MNRPSALGHLLALAVSLVWGTTYISTKVLLVSFHPVEILIFRFVLAWAILFLCAPRPMLPRSLRSELPFLGAALSGLTFYSLLKTTPSCSPWPPLWDLSSPPPPCLPPCCCG